MRRKRQRKLPRRLRKLLQARNVTDRKKSAMRDKPELKATVAWISETEKGEAVPQEAKVVGRSDT